MCPGDRGTDKQRWWRLGSNGQQDTHSQPRKRYWLSRRNCREKGGMVRGLGGLCIPIATRGHLSPILLASEVMAWDGTQPCTVIAKGLGLGKANSIKKWQINRLRFEMWNNALMLNKVNKRHRDWWEGGVLDSSGTSSSYSSLRSTQRLVGRGSIIRLYNWTSSSNRSLRSKG